LKRRKETLPTEKYTNPPEERVTEDPKLFPAAMQSHARPYTASNSYKKKTN
jgi:hypothetical protein